ncbi:MAG: hypothetical protein CMJ79_04070 [Planctomycetaceae bacterium]|nr:hypothetical protein [Planctomycetaceae bacterium]|tara:strand:+ start:7448 stop:7753 length:306 start_codon:yes stop_codon:yes gene_type:complete
MIHYSCDCCQRPIDSTTDLRYVVKLEVQATMDLPELDAAEDERDHLLEIEELLDELGESNLDYVDEDYQRRRYDLCSRCYQDYIKNPLGLEKTHRVDFSQN